MAALLAGAKCEVKSVPRKYLVWIGVAAIAAQCPQCGASIEDSQKFCSECGYNLAKLSDPNGTVPAVRTTVQTAAENPDVCCNKCGTVIESGSQFCFECGASVVQSSEPQKAPLITAEADGTPSAGVGANDAAAGFLGALWGGSASCGCGCFSLVVVVGLLAVLGAFL